jgi:L-asparaginase II
MPVMLAEVVRGPVVECQHFGAVAVVDAEGKVIASAGDTGVVAFLRSAAKPFQAIPAVASGAADAYGFSAAELAICAGSHSGEPGHLAVVGGTLGRLGLGDDALGCGLVSPMDRATSARIATGQEAVTTLHCGCSGKHTGMLAACLQRGYPLDSYLDLDHPLQQEILDIMADHFGVPAAEIPTAADGCGVPTFGASIAQIARAWARLAAPTDAYRASVPHILDAMAAEPWMVAGTDRICTELMPIVGPGIVVKTGAEGLFCLALREQGWGMAIKVADGGIRALPVITAAVLGQLGVVTEAQMAQFLDRQPSHIRNNAGAIVGEIRATFSLN